MTTKKIYAGLLSLLFASVILLLNGCSTTEVKTDDNTVTEESYDSELDWPWFRGTTRDGKSLQKNIPRTFPATGPEKIWSSEIGSSFSGVSVVKDKLFTGSDDGSFQHLVCMNANTGAEIWKYKLDSTFESGWGDGPMGTPVVSEGLVYIISAFGKIAAVNSETGTEVWSKSLEGDFEYQQPFYGYASTPAVDDKLLYIQSGGKEDAAFLALNKKTGDLVWSSETDAVSYTSPFFITINGVRQVVFLSATRVCGLSPEDGSLLWQFYWESWCSSGGPMNSISPYFIAPDKIFISGSTGSVTGASFCQVVDSSGNYWIDELWYNQEMNNVFNPSIEDGGYLYGLHEKMLRCVDASTGEMKWEQKGYGRGSLIFADGLLFVMGENGNFGIAEAKPDGYNELLQLDLLDGRCWTAPTIANGKLYLRNQKEIICFKLV